ncbi:MAG: hypothetical protein HZB25_03045 [Candidatus Eisenbacteria bacterium]|nr:hypothetical protein [Candidatus Eisenbacteria bacterium]
MAASSPAVQLSSSKRWAPLPPDAPFYKRLWRGWQRVAQAIGLLLSRVVTTILYFVAVAPFALVSRLFTDPLELKARPPRWTSLPPAGELKDAQDGF